MMASIAAFALLASTAGAEPATRFRQKACHIAHKLQDKLECGSLIVYEDREAHSGRKLALNVAIVKARRPDRKAIFWITGGPGESAVDEVSWVLNPSAAQGGAPPLGNIEPLRERYDFVFMDQRGTGGSHPLQCNFYPPGHPELYFEQIFPDALVKSCRDRLARTTNLSLYNTNISVDDLDDLRRTLGYPKVALWGGSYGTILSFVYMRRYPDSIEGAALQDVATPDFRIPLPDPKGGQLALDKLVSDCARDSLCRREYPNLGAHFVAVMRRFDRGPQPVPLTDKRVGRDRKVRLSSEVLGDNLRHVLYSTRFSAYVPFAIERAYRNDYGPLATMMNSVILQLGGLIDYGEDLSVTCAEDIPFISESDVRRESAGTFIGDRRIRAQQRACSIWNVRAVSTDFLQPVRTNIPVLMIQGAEDAGSPPQFARLALRYLPNGREVLVPNASHYDTYGPCENNLVVKFILAHSVKNIDSTCVGHTKRPPFATSLSGFKG